ncbi:MAG: S8 family serine peptidase [Bacteroidetes bacterium]|nr:S8 family serine peptidase [Bacteroidota bacterium]
MKKFTLIWVVLMLSQLLVHAQSKEFSVFHKNGVFTPDKGNILRNQAQSSYLLFDEKYYVMIQFQQIPSQQIKESLLSKGIELSGYIPNHTYFASVPLTAKKLDLKSLNIRSVFACHKDLKMDKRLKDPEHLAAWAMQDELIQVKIKLTNGVNLSKVKTQLEKINGELKINVNLHSTWLNMKVSKMTLVALANEPYIEWIEPIHPPLVTDNLPGKTMHGSAYIGNINNRNLTGKNIKVGEWDGGYVGKHIDFDARKTTLDSLVYSDHATHVAGTITSAGIINPYATGMAPEAILYSSDFYDDIQAEMDSTYARHHINITSNSYGYSPAYDPCPMGNYDGESQRIDELVYKYNDLIHVFAAANSQSQCSGGYRTISSGFNSSKNVITVGAVNYRGEMSNFSSWGPTVDGRLKPEICGVGVNVYSTLDGDKYIGGFNGTSMATPGVSGTVAQLYQLYQTKYSTNPDASIIRAIVCNTATDKGNAHADYQYGFGIINSIKAAEMIDSSRFQTDTISDANTHTYTYDIASGVSEFKLTLAWTDKEASSSSNILVNNLDAYIITPANDTIRPWILDPNNPANTAVRGIDNVNNVEQITIDNPTAGTYTLYVNGASVPYGPQLYTITAYSQVPELLLTYPNGNEKLTPGTVETIRWNSFATSQGFSLDYSLDSGATWTNIDNNINVNHYDWSVPNVSSSNVLIKIYNNSFMDSSDGVFTIFNPTANLSAIACSSAVSLSWNSVASANSYHIYRLNQSNTTWSLLDSTNSSTTTYTDVNVVNGNNYYYTVTVLGQNGMESNRAYAISAKPDATTNGLITISGSTTLLCGDQITLTAKVANSYLWSNGATSQSIQVTTAGAYQVEIVYNASCTAKSGLVNIRDGFSVAIDDDTLCEGNTTMLHAQSRQMNTLRLTEIVQNKAAYGAPSSYPSWITSNHPNADFVELSNMGDDTLSIGGMTFELWDGSGVLRSYTWPTWAQLLPSETSVLHIGNTATDDSTHMFFNTGGSDDASASGDSRGYILRDINNKTIDAVAVNNFVFSPSSGVNEFDFVSEDPSPFMQGYAGVRLQTADFNRGKEWTLSSPSNTIDLSTYNAGIKTIENAKIIWTDSASFYKEGTEAVTDTFHNNTRIYGILKTINCTQYKAIDLTYQEIVYAATIPSRLLGMEMDLLFKIGYIKELH